jgi:hypothetical protein
MEVSKAQAKGADESPDQKHVEDQRAGLGSERRRLDFLLRFRRGRRRRTVSAIGGSRNLSRAPLETALPTCREGCRALRKSVEKPLQMVGALRRRVHKLHAHAAAELGPANHPAEGDRTGLLLLEEEVKLMPRGERVRVLDVGSPQADVPNLHRHRAINKKGKRWLDPRIDSTFFCC